MKSSLFLFFILFTSSVLQAQDTASPADREAAYTQTINTRAEKIVAALNLPDKERIVKISALVAGQYRALNTIYTRRDEQVKLAKAAVTSDKEGLAGKIKLIEEETVKNTKTLHAAFLHELSRELTPDQVDQIKNGMTYNVLNVTYSGYMSMLPNLTDAQKTQILQWLTEARENAMDAESSEKKHWWFGKYKGRINNYLSSAGYDMKKEGEAWQKRLAEEKQQKAN